MSQWRGKAETFMQHLEPLQRVLEAYCRRSLNDSNALSDVLQSAVANAYRDFHRYVEGTNFRAWIFRYVHLGILNSNRSSTRFKQQIVPVDLPLDDTWQMALDEPLLKVLLDDPDEILEQCDTVLAQAIREMESQERAILLLQAIGDFKYREIGEILQIPIGTVMSTLARCRVRLRQRLIRYGEELGLLKPGEIRG